MIDSVRGQDGGQCNELPAIIGIECAYLCTKVVLNQSLESDKRFFHLGFLFKRIEPCVSGVVINKDKVVFELLGRKKWGCPDVTIETFKWSVCLDSV